MSGFEFNEQLLASSSVFRHLSPNALKSLAVVARLSRFNQRTLLSPVGQKEVCLRYIVEGMIEVSLSALEGKSASIPILPGQWTSWVATMGERAEPHELWASKSAIVFELPARNVREAISSSPEALAQVILSMGQTVDVLTGWILRSTAQTPEQRLAYLLLWASAGVTAKAAITPARVLLTHEQIVQFGFGSRQRVSRLLKALEAKGLVEVSYGAISVLSPEGLARHVNDLQAIEVSF